MTLTDLQQQLATPEGFAKVVTPKRAAFGVAITSLVLAAAGIVMNLLQLGSASDWDWRLILRFFFDAGAVEFTGSRAGRSEVWRFFAVYGPLVLIPLGIILLIVHFATRRSAGSALFADFQARGWVARQLLPGLKVKNGNADVAIAFFSHPSISDAEYEAVVQHYSGFLRTLDKKGLKAVATAAQRAKVLTGVSVAALAPDLPPVLLAAPVQGNGPFAIVVPAADGTKVTVLPIKQKV